VKVQGLIGDSSKKNERSALPRKTSKHNTIQTVPQTDTGVQGE